MRWIEGCERLAELALELPATRLMQVGDHAGDLFALMPRAQSLGWPESVDQPVRSRYKRVLSDAQ